MTGVGVMDQVVPFHDSASVSLPPFAPKLVPTAMQEVAETQDTAYRSFQTRDRFWVVRITDQVRPSHTSASVLAPWRAFTLSPTAMQAVADGHDTAEKPPGTAGVLILDQVLPFHDSATGKPPRAWPTATVPGRAFVHDLRGLGFQQRQVAGRCGAAVRHVASGLSQSQGQITEQLSDLGGLSWAEASHPIAQNCYRLGARQHVDFDHHDNPPPARRAGSDQHVPVPDRQPLAQRLGVHGVVEHEQPAVSLAELMQDHGLDSLSLVTGFSAAQFLGQGGELVTDQGRRFGRYPPGQVVGPGEPVGVFDGDLRRAPF